jgi:hypothetical protein
MQKTAAQRVCRLKKIQRKHLTPILQLNLKIQVLDVSEDKNEKMVEKYQADGSSLFLTHMDGKKETTTDFTNFAFSYSRNQAEKFISGLKAEIEKNLK